MRAGTAIAILALTGCTSGATKDSRTGGSEDTGGESTPGSVETGDTDMAVDSDTGGEPDSADTGQDSDTQEDTDTAPWDPPGYKFTGSDEGETTDDATGIEYLTMGGRGDLTGNGTNDVVLGFGIAGTDDHGAGYVIDGTDLGNATAAGAATATAIGAAGETLAAGAVTVGDFDGDGRSDLLIGAARSDDDGQAYLFYGPLSGDHLSSEADATLSPSCTGADTPFCRFGRIVDAGDFDGDPYSDLIIGNVYEAIAWILPGPITGDVDVRESASASLSFNATANYADAMVVGDATGDGLDDIVVSTSTSSDPQGAFLLEGGLIGEITDADATASWAAPTEYWAQYHGGRATDLDGDGYLDLAISEHEPLSSDYSYDGAVSVVYGPFAGTTNLPGADRVTGSEDSNFGVSLRSLPDLDGDGCGELAVGAREYDDDKGVVYVFAGPIHGTSDAADSAAVTILDGDNVDAFGCVVSSADDLDGDGLPELLVGAWGDDDYGMASGAVWVYPGGTLLGR